MLLNIKLYSYAHGQLIIDTYSLSLKLSNWWFSPGQFFCLDTSAIYKFQSFNFNYLAMCIYDNVFVFEWYFVIFKAGHFEKLFFNKRYNCGNFSLEYYVKSSITLGYSLIPFSCEIRQCAFRKVYYKLYLRVTVY